MAKLTTRARKALPKSDFAVPSKAPGPGSYPIENRSHAADAKARASGKPVEARVDRAVARKFPGMGKSHDKRSSVPGGEHHADHHREPRSHDEFHKLGNDGKW